MAPDRSDDLVILTSLNEDPAAFLMTFQGSAGVWSLKALEIAFTQASNSGNPLVVDLSALVSGDEVLLGFLLAARSRAGIVLIGPPAGSFATRLAVTGIDQIIDLHADLGRALKALSEGAFRVGQRLDFGNHGVPSRAAELPEGARKAQGRTGD